MEPLVQIEQPRSVVFAFVTDHSNDVQWKPFVVACYKTTAGPIGVDTEFSVITKVAGHHQTTTVTVLVYEPCTRFVYQSASLPLPFVAELGFQEVPAGTLITGQVIFHVRGWARLIAPLVQRMMDGQSQATFRKLKHVLEASS